jgi:hypothetical protein
MKTKLFLSKKTHEKQTGKLLIGWRPFPRVIRPQLIWTTWVVRHHDERVFYRHSGHSDRGVLYSG